MRQSKRIKAKPTPVEPDSEDEYSDDQEEKVEYKPERKPTTRTTKTGPSGGTNRSAKLTVLLTMPLDILFEIFGHLEPLELVNLTHVNRAFRDTLIASNATSVWKCVRLRRDAPDPVPGYTEIAWATFLFGPNVCEICGSNRPREPDFAILRKSCKQCLKANLLYEGKNKNRFCKTTLELVPYTNTGNSTKSASRFFWIPELNQVEQRLDELHSDVRRGKAGAQQHLERYSAKRMEFVTQIREDAPVLKEWYYDYLTASRNERDSGTEARRDRRQKEVNDRFLALGYQECDLKEIQGEARKGPALTENIWQRLLAKLETKVIEARNRRVLAERHATMYAVLKKHCFSIFQAYPPLDWNKLPRAFDLSILPAVQAAFEAETGEISETTFNNVDFSSVVALWIEERKENLWNQVKTSDLFIDHLPEMTDDLERREHIFNLATTVFSCKTVFCLGDVPIIGIDGALRHHCVAEFYGTRRHQHREAIPTELQFSPMGSQVASSLIVMAELDPTTATPSDMDELPIRYISRHRFINFMSPHRKVFNWRQAIQHRLEHHLTAQFRSLTAEELLNVSQATYPVFENWICTHCLEYVEDPKPQTDVTTHLQTMHAIENPAVGEDLISIISPTKEPHDTIVL